MFKSGEKVMLVMLCQTVTSHFQAMLLLLVLISLKMKMDLQDEWQRLVGSLEAN